MKFKHSNHITTKQNQMFQFNWRQLIDKHSTWLFYQLIINSNLIGIIAITKESGFIRIHDVEVAKGQRGKHYGATLIAFAMWISLNTNNDNGFVQLISKTGKTEGFYKHLGGLGLGQRFIFTHDASSRVVKKYQPKEGFQID